MATLPYWNNDEVISSDKLNSMVQAIINGDPLAVKVSNATKNDVNQIIDYLFSLHNTAKTNLNSATSTNDFDTAYTNMTALVSNKLGSYANDDTVDLYSTGIRASILTFLQAYDNMMSKDRLNNKNTDNTLNSRIDNEAKARSDADTNINNSLNAIKANGGGRNLALGTSNSWSTAPDVDQYNITTIATYTNAQAGDVFTVSVDTQSSKNLAYQIWQGSSEYARDKFLTGGDHWSIGSGTTHSHTTFTWPSGATQYLIVQLIDNMPDASHASYQYKNVMLEKGTIAHDWQPAPEDVGANIDAKINNKISIITSKGGGRNLWINSKSFANICINTPKVDFDTGSDGIRTAHVTGTGGFFGFFSNIYIDKIEPFAIGDSETFSVEMKGSGTITIARENNFSKTVTLTDTWTRYSVSGTVTKLNSVHTIYSADDKDRDAYVRLPMVEGGLIAHDWQPAPEDVEANIDTKVNVIANNGGGRNLLRYSTNDNGKFQPNCSRTDNYIIYHASTVYMTQGQQYTVHANASSGLAWSSTHDPSKESNNVVLWLTDESDVSQIISDANTGTRTTFTWDNPSGTYFLRVNTYKVDNSGYVEKVMLEKGSVAHDWQLAPEDFDNYTSGRTITLPNNSSITVNDDRITPKIKLPTYFTDYTVSPYLNNLATIGECDNLFIPSSTVANLNNLPTNPDTGSDLTGDCFFTNHYACSGNTVRAFQKLYSCDYNYIFIRSYNGSSGAWSNWSCLTPYA